MKRNSRILVTAPSNAACDEVAIRLLLYVPRANLFRFYARSAEKRISELHPDLVKRSNLKDGEYRWPQMSKLYNCGIIVTTCTNSGRLALNGFQKNHFDYIFIDECGSATEPSAIIPLAGLVSYNQPGLAITSLVIAGDPKQLGPTVMCHMAETSGLGRSMLERLMDLDLYKPDPTTGKFNPKVVTKLLQNYRSHPAILNIANDLFYDNELMSKADSVEIDWALNWKKLNNKQFPVIFHAIYGTCSIHGTSMSRYNEEEVRKVADYVHEIMSNGINGRMFNQLDIGVISPYRSQCEKIKRNLEVLDYEKIEVGSVEQFQGQERDIIILSTVRSKVSQLGFLNNPKRLNVSITRAKGLLIIIGNPDTLRMNRNWYRLIQYCEENNSVIYPPVTTPVPSQKRPVEPFEFKPLKDAVDVDYSVKIADHDPENEVTANVPGESKPINFKQFIKTQAPPGINRLEKPSLIEQMTKATKVVEEIKLQDDVFLIKQSDNPSEIEEKELQQDVLELKNAYEPVDLSISNPSKMNINSFFGKKYAHLTIPMQRPSNEISPENLRFIYERERKRLEQMPTKLSSIEEEIEIDDDVKDQNPGKVEEKRVINGEHQTKGAIPPKFNKPGNLRRPQIDLERFKRMLPIGIQVDLKRRDANRACVKEEELRLKEEQDGKNKYYTSRPLISYEDLNFETGLF